jgi:fibrillarin-like rRNA methylase
MKFCVTKDVVEFYEVEAENEQEAIELVEEGDLDPYRTDESNIEATEI